MPGAGPILLEAERVIALSEAAMLDLRQHGVRVAAILPGSVDSDFSRSGADADTSWKLAAEDVARTLGCTRGQAFTLIALPQAWRGMIAATTIAWARALGEFGPILVFAGATRMRTAVLSTSVFLELSIGELGAAVSVSLLMVAMAVVVLIVLRILGTGLTS